MMGRAPCCDKANVKRGPWSPEEDAKLKSYIQQHGTGGNWIALPHKIGLKRCGKSCRLRWLNYLRPNIKHGSFSEEEDHVICTLYLSIGSRWSIIAAQLPGRTDNDIKNYWNTKLKKKLLGSSSKQERPSKDQQHYSKKGHVHVSCKQEIMMNKETTSTLDHFKATPAAASCSMSMNQLYPSYSYWLQPDQFPLLMTTTSSNYSHDHNQENQSQDPIKTLLLKLGGRFNSDDQPHDTNIEAEAAAVTSTLNNPYQFSGVSSDQDQLFDQTNQKPIASAAYPHGNYPLVSGGRDGSLINEEFSNYPLDQLMDELMAYNTSSQLDLQEFGDGMVGYCFSGVDHNLQINIGSKSNSSTSSSAESTTTTTTTWGSDIPLVCPPPPPMVYASHCQHGLIQKDMYTSSGP